MKALFLLAALAVAPAQDTPSQPPPVRLPPLLDFTEPFDHSAFEAALGGIAEAFPDLMRVRSLGRSRGGRDLWLAVLADTSAEEPRRHPSAVVLTDPAADDTGEVAGPEAALFVLESLLLRARDDPALRERFRRSALYFLPAPDPDRAFASVPPRGATGDAMGPGAPVRDCRLEENFPARWLPFGPEVRAPGPYALSEPESLALARFLLERENVSTLVVLSRSDAERVEPGPGSLRAYAREVLDLALSEGRPWKGDPRSTIAGMAPAGFEAAAELAAGTLDSLPQLACGRAQVERLRPDLWLLDLPLQNRGRFPTLGEECRRPGVPSVSMQVAGGRVVACAVREAGEESYRALPEGLELLPLGHLDGLEVLDVRLVVQAEEGSELSVSFVSARAGTATVGAALR